MDPFAHTFAGAALAASGLQRKTPLAMAVLLMGANAPDIDVVAAFGEPFVPLQFRRGMTHGVLALAVLPFALTGIVLLFDRFVRRKRAPDAPPARAGPLLALAALAVLTHPALDWLNNYGLRWLMPFDGRWFYGDAVLIIDPWIWLALGGVAFLAYSRRRAAFAAWCCFWSLASLLVLFTPVPLVARVLWLAALAALFAARFSKRSAQDDERLYERAARIAIAGTLVYATTLALVDLVERSSVSAEARARDIRPLSVMVAPVPANPFASDVVIETDDAYHFGRWRWLREPKLVLDSETIRKRMTDPAAAAAARTIEAERYLTWARFPYADIAPETGGHVVKFYDARYHTTGRLFGPIVHLDHDLKPRAAE